MRVPPDKRGEYFYFPGEETDSTHLTYLLTAITSHPEVEKRFGFIYHFLYLAGSLVMDAEKHSLNLLTLSIEIPLNYT